MLNYLFATSGCNTSSFVFSNTFSTWIALVSILGGLMFILIFAFSHVFYSQRKTRKLEVIKVQKLKEIKKLKKIELTKIKVKKKK